MKKLVKLDGKPSLINIDKSGANLSGIEAWQMIRKGQQKWIGATSPVEQFYVLAA